MASTRESCPWFELELKLHMVNDQWEDVINSDEKFYSLDGALNPTIEREANTRLIVAGPMLDTYIKELGSIIINILSRGKGTGIQKTKSILIPWQVMVNLMKLIKRYGGKVESKVKKNKEKQFTITMVEQTYCEQVWHPRRCGKKYLSRRKFKKEPLSPGKFAYDGYSKVLITSNTPICISYCTRTQKASMTFYVQRYDSEDIPLDAALQDKIIQ